MRPRVRKRFDLDAEVSSSGLDQVAGRDARVRERQRAAGRRAMCVPFAPGRGGVNERLDAARTLA
jgi:hypothetical protein